MDLASRDKNLPISKLFSSCPDKATSPVPCDAGTYAPSGSLQCYGCPLGASCPNIKMPTYIMCTNGSYNDVSNATTCKSCPPGKKCPNPTEAPVDCPDGMFSKGGSLDCTQCPGGYRQVSKHNNPYDRFKIWTIIVTDCSFVSISFVALNLSQKFILSYSTQNPIAMLKALIL